MTDDPHTDSLCRHKTDNFRQQHRNRKTDQQCQKTAHHIFCQQHGKKFWFFHAHHQVDAKFVSAALELIFAGKVDQKEQDSQGQHIEHRNQ